MGMSYEPVQDTLELWECQIFNQGRWERFHDGDGVSQFPSPDKAWDCARRCFPDTEHLSSLVRVVKSGEAHDEEV